MCDARLRWSLASLHGLLVVCGTPSTAVSQPAPPAVRAEVCALTVAVPALESGGYVSDAFGVAGSGVAILLSSDRLMLMGLASDPGSVRSFTDDTGRDLLSGVPAATQPEGQPYGRWIDTRVSHEPAAGLPGRHRYVMYRAPQAPAGGASRVSLQGTIRVRTSASTTEMLFHDLKPVVGPIGNPADDISITSVGTPTLVSHSSAGSYAIRIRIGSDLAPLVGDMLLDGIPGGYGSVQNVNSLPALDFEFHMATEPGAFALRLFRLDEINDIDVPVDATFGVGLTDACTPAP